MGKLLFTEKDPGRGYITNNLLIPKEAVNLTAIKSALSFVIGEEDVVEEDTGMIMGSRPKIYELWDETAHHVVVPREFINRKDRADFDFSWIEEELEMTRVILPDKIVPRDETQMRALAAMRKHRGGTVNLACVAGDSVISFSRGGKSFKMPIAKAYRHWLGAERYIWDRSIPTLVRARKGDSIGLHQVEAIVYKGKRLTKTLTLANGQKLRLTPDHQVLTTRGWKSIDQGLQPGDLVYTDGERNGSIRKPKPYYKRLSWYPAHPHAREEKRKGRKSSYFLEEHRAVAEATLNDMTLAEYRDACMTGRVHELKFIDPSVYHVHHIDEDTTNNHPDNLEVLLKEEHLDQHRPGAKAFGYGEPVPVEVKSIGKGKLEDVYDIACKDPHHNFVANGIVVHNCGKGKTVIALKYAVEKQVPTLVVVNTAALLHQWMLEVKEHVGKNFKIGQIQGSVCRWKGCPIVIATVQTLANKRDEWSMEFRRHFGVIFFDEGHHLSAPHFVKSADLFFGERFSLTATATRTDGLESIYQYHLGPVIYVDLDQELIPDTFFHQLNWSPNEEQDRASRDITGQRHHGKLCVMLGTVKWRNRLIVRHIRQDMKQKRQILVLTHSVEHSRELYQLYMKKSGNENAGLINGEDVPAEERIPILRESNPVFGTFQLAREALNKQTLDTLFVCTPFGNANDLQQSWGRIQRMKEGKHDPRVRLYEDVQIPTCAKQCRKLRKFLRAMKYPAKILKEALG